MKEPKKIPIDPTVPRSKIVKAFPLSKLYADRMVDDVYLPDKTTTTDHINPNEDSEKSTET